MWSEDKLRVSALIWLLTSVGLTLFVLCPCRNGRFQRNNPIECASNNSPVIYYSNVLVPFLPGESDYICMSQKYTPYCVVFYPLWLHMSHLRCSSDTYAHVGPLHLVLGVICTCIVTPNDDSPRELVSSYVFYYLHCCVWLPPLTSPDLYLRVHPRVPVMTALRHTRITLAA